MSVPNEFDRQGARRIHALPLIHTHAHMQLQLQSIVIGIVNASYACPLQLQLKFGILHVFIRRLCVCVHVSVFEI